MHQNISVNLVDVSKKMGQKKLFEGLTASVHPGQCLAITGSNGSGKSTLIKMIAGLLRVTSGKIQIASNERILDVEERMACIGLVSPEIMFYVDMTGSENILFFTQARGQKCTTEEVGRWCQFVGLAPHKDEFVHTYSTGMRQRLKLALLLAIKPSLWLLDEPSSNLDEGGKMLVKKIIAQGLAEQATLIIGTNEGWEAEYANYKIELIQ